MLSHRFEPPPDRPDLAAGTPAPDAPCAEFASLLDDPQEWPSFGRARMPAGAGADADATAQTWESHVVLEGMHCAACALTIEDVLRAVPGVAQADVSAATRRARVVWNAAHVRPSQWIAAVRRAGYRALPAMDAFARAQRQGDQERP